MQHRSWILGICGRAAGTALALAIMLVPAVLATRSAQAQTYTFSVPHSFTGPPDGGIPYAGVVWDAQGNLYGTTSGGGASAYGTVFKLDTTGNETVLYSFTGTGTDGLDPQGNLMRDAKGNLYGTTVQGGVGCTAEDGCGTVFKLDTAGKETVLHDFTGSPDGSSSFSGLVRDTQGNLYGTTSGGGEPACKFGCGTVFKLDKAGNEIVLYSFTGGTDGGSPYPGLVRDTQGNLYGTTAAGGDNACKNGCGIVFKLDATDHETVLYSFTGGADGLGPQGNLVRDAQGNLYGTSGGGASGYGTVFKLDASGKETVLYGFTGATKGDGAYPSGSLVRDAQGNLYGTTSSGGVSLWWGTVFKVDKNGKETVLYSFTGGADGQYPNGLVRDTQGNLYGTTSLGGASGYGTVFKLTPAAVTTTTLSSSPNPSSYGQPVTFTAEVTSKLGAPPDGETVSFMKGTTLLGTGTLSDGSATFTMSTLKVGTTSVTAVYAGDSKFAGSKSKAVKQVVEKAE
jgi:uncharacterized repeat protein (TIGR03803 family)